MHNDVTGNDEAITAEAIVIAVNNRDNHPLPEKLSNAAKAEPLALYIAIKYLQSLPQDDERRSREYALKAVLLGRYSDFVEEALSSDPSPPDLSIDGSQNSIRKH